MKNILKNRNEKIGKTLNILNSLCINKIIDLTTHK